MNIDLAQLPSDPQALQALLAQAVNAHNSIVAERDAFKARCEALALEKAELLRQLRKRLKDLYGPRSERLSDDQLVLFAELLKKEQTEAPQANERDAGITVTEHKRKQSGRGGRGKLPDHLPRIEVVHDLGEEEKKCPCCGIERVQIGAESSEQLDYVPGTLRVIVNMRSKYACPDCCGHVESAPPPPQAVPKCKAASGLLAHIAVSKFGDHLPLYRQEGILQRHGLLIARSTQCDWLRQMAGALEPLTARMKELVLESKVIQSDDTPVKLQDGGGGRGGGGGGGGRGRTREARFWVYVGDQDHRYALFDFSRSREGRWPQAWLKDYGRRNDDADDGDEVLQENRRRYLQADAYSGYDALYASGGSRSIIEVGCWAHARRKFYDSRMVDPACCLPVLERIRKLYAIESESREAGEDAEARQRRRIEHAKPVLEELKGFLESQRDRVLPRSGVGEAVVYALNNWTALVRYLEDGDLEIDNNACERAVRCVAIGRKNWLFAGSEVGGETAATLFSLIGSARLHEIEPWLYMRDVLDRIPAATRTDLDDLLPDRWKLAHPEAHLPLGR
jgi:transposase